MIKLSNIAKALLTLPLREGLGVGFILLLLASCQQDEVEQVSAPAFYPVELLMGMNEQPDGGVITRALPTGYSVFNPGDEDPGMIGMFMTQTEKVGETTTYSSPAGYFEWKNPKWTSNVSVKYDKKGGPVNTYYAYGFMPAGGSIAASISSTDYATGATMTLRNVQPVSTQDMCIVTGVLTAQPTTTDPLTYPAIEDVDIKVGEYTYTSDTISNAIYLLLDHIYSKYSLKMKIDADYNKLRTIKMKDIRLSASAPAVDITVTYLRNEKPKVSMTTLSSTATLDVDILDTETTMTTTATSLASFYCCKLLDYLTLTTTFDVYDTGGNLVRSNCKATNKIKVQNLEAGKAYTIEATVQPSYLYQLSEIDLNKPTIEIN